MNRRLILNSLAASVAMMVANQATARPLHFLLEQKVKAYREKMEFWSQSPDVIAMARDRANKSDKALASADWTSRSNSPEISALLNNHVSQKLQKMASDPAIAKLALLNAVGDVLGSSARPRQYNLGETMAFSEAIFSGGTWSANRARIDPIINKYVVTLSAPIIDRNREIGVLYLQLHADS